MSRLVPCPHCHQHLVAGSRRCPHCSHCVSCPPRSKARTAFALLGLAACGDKGEDSGGDEPNPQPEYGVMDVSYADDED